MKHYLFFLALPLLALAACGDDGGEAVGLRVANANSNLSEPNRYTHRMEFPRVSHSGGSTILVHTLRDGEVNYSVEYDTGRKTTRWSCYELYSSNRETHTSRYRPGKGAAQYPQDPLLDAEYRWGQDPFWRSGYDHGHLCPSADRLHTEEANVQTFYLTNMMPQAHGFNAGVWATMEAWVRDLVKVGSRDTLFVVKGGTIDDASLYTAMDRKGGRLIVPKYYYMALLLRNASGYRAMGFWIEHKASSTEDLGPYVVSIDRLERLTGLDFFCNLPDDIESQVEGQDADNVRRAWGW